MPAASAEVLGAAFRPLQEVFVVARAVAFHREQPNGELIHCPSPEPTPESGHARLGRQVLQMQLQANRFGSFDSSRSPGCLNFFDPRVADERKEEAKGRRRGARSAWCTKRKTRSVRETRSSGWQHAGERFFGRLKKRGRWEGLALERKSTFVGNSGRTVTQLETLRNLRICGSKRCLSF